jgi:diaminohydroxyphosphoribosylaminopyrimidine deaminase / 5-amino-6-(5-phosphoribosylamino)uracil reductase
VFTEPDRRYMARALELAERGLYTTTPNPRVGCVIVGDGEVVGEGWHERAGGAHAEVAALEQAGRRAADATVYVSLEPCAHHGRTPPCSEALAASRVARVIAAMTDPNPLVAGKGLERLRAAGIETASGLMEDEARRLNAGFVSRMTRSRPWVRLKIAASLDGRTALANGRSQWITGAAARRDGHAWRARACAVMTGVGTVRHDDPRLDVRDIETPRQPSRIVVDSRVETPPSARVVGPGTLIVGANAARLRVAALEAAGAEVLVLPASDHRVDLTALMRELARRQMNEIHVEAGPALSGALIEAQLADELIVYFAPRLMGHTACGMFALRELEDLDAARALTLTDVRRIGEDVRVIAAVRS